MDMKQKYHLKRLLKAIFIGRTIKSLRPETRVTGLTGQAMLSRIFKSVGSSNAEVSYATAKEDSRKLSRGNSRYIIPWAGGALVVASGIIYAAIALLNPAVLPPLTIENPVIPLTVFPPEEDDPVIPAINDGDQAPVKEAEDIPDQPDITVFSVDIVDKDYPYVETYDMEGDMLMLWLHDATSGIDFAQVYCVNSAGKKLYPADIKPEDSLAVFQMPWPKDNGILELELYMSDNAGNQIINTIYISVATYIDGGEILTVHL